MTEGQPATAQPVPADLERARDAYNRGVELKRRFEQSGKLADIDEAVRVLAAAVDAAGPDFPGRPGILSVLGTAEMARFEVTANPADLDEGVAHCRAAVAAAEALGAPGRVELANLGYALLRHYQQGGDPTELDEALRLARRVLSITPPSHPDYASHLADVSNQLRIRFWHTGDLRDLEEAIEQARAAVDAAPPGSASRGNCLTMLAGAFHARFSRTGDPDDLDRAIDGLRSAVGVTPADSLARRGRQGNLGMGLRMRASQLGSLADLDEAVAVLRDALAHMGPADRQRPLYLSELGAAFLSRFGQTSRPYDLDLGVRCLSLGVALTPAQGPDRSIRMANLGAAIEQKFFQTGDLADLDESIRVARDALSLTAPGQPSRASALAGLARRLRTRFGQTKDPADLRDSVEAARAAVAACPSGDPDIARHLMTLADLLSIEHGAGLGEAIACWQRAARTESAPASVRVSAAVSWGGAAAAEGRFELAEEGFGAAVELLPVLAWRGLDRGSQERQLAQQQGLASDAAACAIAAGHPERAVELLEQGRIVLWSERLQLRGEFDDARAAWPELTERLDAIRAEFDPLAREQDLRLAAPPGQAPEAVSRADERVRLAREWDEIVAGMRKSPSFAHFLAAPPFAELARAAAGGTAVIVNVSQFRCDALAVTPGGVTVIPLPGLTAAQATYRANQFLEALRELADAPVERSGSRDRPDPSRAMDEVLGWLADAVTGPVLDRLGFGCAAEGPLPRLWWCPTGPVTVLPLHAAGRDGAGGRVLDRVVSSYASSLRTLRDAKERPVRAGDPRMLLVTMPVTPYLPDQAPLPGTFTETLVVARRFSAVTTHLFSETATVSRVLDALEHTRYAHFACHGSADPVDPSRGGLDLYDGPLTIRDLSDRDLRGAELAVLSACQSATGSVRHLDEAITLAAATQLAGFRHVIATLWNLIDMAAPQVAEDVYDTLSDAAVSVEAVAGSARALHGAVRELRDAGDPVALWAPFIHLGP